LSRSTKDRSHFEPYFTSGPFQNQRRCQSFKKGTDVQCGGMAVNGFEVCAKHGGKPTSGRPITTGERSKFIPKNLEQSLKDFMEDPELTGLRKEIAAVCYRQEQVLESIKLAEAQKVSTKPFWEKWDELAQKKTSLTVAENKRQAQLASNLNARQANVLRAVLISVLVDVCRDESIPRSQIPKVVGLKLVQKMS
jgi:hypothetical protein